MAYVKVVRVHRSGGQIRNVGEVYSTEDKLILGGGYVVMCETPPVVGSESESKVDEADKTEEVAPKEDLGTRNTMMESSEQSMDTDRHKGGKRKYRKKSESENSGEAA